MAPYGIDWAICLDSGVLLRLSRMNVFQRSQSPHMNASLLLALFNKALTLTFSVYLPNTLELENAAGR